LNTEGDRKGDRGSIGDVSCNCFSDKSDFVAFQDKARQSSGREGARVDVDTVWSNVRLEDGRVPMHDNFAKMVLAKEEILSNPEKVIFRLLGKANSRSNSCVYKEKITANEIWLQAAQELAVAAWKNPLKFRGEFLLILRIGFNLWRKSI
jgi:hypothetical protein